MAYFLLVILGIIVGYAFGVYSSNKYNSEAAKLGRRIMLRGKIYRINEDK